VAEVPLLAVASTASATVTVRYFAAAAEAAGVEEETLPSVGTVGELRSLLVERYGDAMAKVLASGSFLVDGVVSRDDARAPGARVDVLPPFAGG
jgi:molybdopterin converting factor small subunit